jgi:hypothetical protein
VNILAVEFYGGTVRGFGEPDVEILAFAGFEEEDVVAVVEVGEFVELVQLGFRVELGVFAGVREEGVEVVEEVAMSGWWLVWLEKGECNAPLLEVSYLYVTPREVKMSTRWRFLGLLSPSSSCDFPGFCFPRDL